MPSFQIITNSPVDLERQLMRLPEIFEYLDLGNASAPALLGLSAGGQLTPLTPQMIPISDIAMRNTNNTPVSTQVPAQTKPRSFVSVRRPLHRRNRHLPVRSPDQSESDIGILPIVLVFSVFLLIAILVSVIAQ